MMDLIDFMDRMGREAPLRYAERDVLTKALVDAQIDPLARKAVVAADQRHLEFLLGAQPNVCCLVNVPHGDDDAKEMPKKASPSPMDEAA